VQAQVDGSATVSVVVLGDLTVVRVRHLTFGTVVSNSGAHTVTRESSQSGFMRIVGDWNKRVTINLNHRPTQLVHSVLPTATIPLDLVVHFTPRAGGLPGVTPFCNGFTRVPPPGVSRGIHLDDELAVAPRRPVDDVIEARSSD
jgi:hypothetical protein